MNYIEEINYRNQLLQRKINGGKISPEEKLWLETHPVYNQILGFPYLNRDIIQLKANGYYRVRIGVESRLVSERIHPIISVPGKKGSILVKNELFDCYGNKVAIRPVKVLGVLYNQDSTNAEFIYRSKLGLLEISYQCEFFDERMRCIRRESSNTGNTMFAMLREKIADNKLRYRCKFPNNQDYNSYVFFVEWSEIDSKEARRKRQKTD